MPVDKLNEKEIKALKRLIMTENKKKNTPAGRIDDLNKLMDEKASREGNPNTITNQESLMQGLKLDKAGFLGEMVNKLMQTPQYNQNNQNNNNAVLDILKIFLPLIISQNQSPPQKPESTNNALVSVFGQMFQSLNQQSQNYLTMLINQMSSGQGQTQISPEDRLFKSMDVINKIQGEHRERTKDEMVYALEKDKLVLQENSRQDMLNREERAIIREDKKSERILDIGGVVLDKIVGNGVGNLINDVMSAGGKKGKRRGRAEQPQSEDFDPSLLDEL